MFYNATSWIPCPKFDMNTPPHILTSRNVLPRQLEVHTRRPTAEQGRPFDLNHLKKSFKSFNFQQLSFQFCLKNKLLFRQIKIKLKILVPWTPTLMATQNQAQKKTKNFTRPADSPEVLSLECPHLAADHGHGVEPSLTLVRRVVAVVRGRARVSENILLTCCISVQKVWDHDCYEINSNEKRKRRLKGEGRDMQREVEFFLIIASSLINWWQF